MGMVYSVVLGVCAFGFFGCGGFDVLVTWMVGGG